jgi:hypothetical protein
MFERFWTTDMLLTYSGNLERVSLPGIDNPVVVNEEQ